MTNANVENELKEIFGLVNTWLHFAEAKNGALIAIVGGVIYKFMEYKKEFGYIHFSILYCLLLGSFLLALLSFYPNISSKNIVPSKLKKIKKNPKNNKDIKIFYGDIAANYSGGNGYIEYLKNMRQDYLKEQVVDINDLTAKEKEYAEEIVINSCITVNKYKFFKWALIFLISFTVYFSVLLLYNSYKENKVIQKIDVPLLIFCIKD